MTYEPLWRWAFAHEQTAHTATYYVKNRFKRRQRPRKVVETTPALPTVAQIAAPDNLFRVYYGLKARAGRSPGPDGFTYADWGKKEVGHILRDLSQDVLAGGYRPGRARPVNVAKPKGGFRTLRIQNLCDRVVASALKEAVEPFWETVFTPWSMGFRPHRGVWRMLAEMEAAMRKEGLWTLVTDDVAKAFDNVVVDDVLADHARHVQDESLLSLIGVVLRGGDGFRQRGIDQGNAYSPLALNVRLHHAHDLGFDTGHPFRQFRYADNLAYLCQNASEGLQILDKARSLLTQAGFSLKGEDGPPADLQRQGKVQLLGFTLTKKNDGLRLGLGRDAWTRLTQNLENVHKTNRPSTTARLIVRGWATAYGPAFESLRCDDLNRILNEAARRGFREIGSRETVERWLQDSWEHWCVLRENTLSDPRTLLHEERWRPAAAAADGEPGAPTALEAGAIPGLARTPRLLR